MELEICLVRGTISFTFHAMLSFRKFVMNINGHKFVMDINGHCCALQNSISNLE